MSISLVKGGFIYRPPGGVLNRDYQLKSIHFVFFFFPFLCPLPPMGREGGKVLVYIGVRVFYIFQSTYITMIKL